jgi:hypothetical protein
VWSQCGCLIVALKSGGVAVTQLILSVPETSTAGAAANSTGYSSSSVDVEPPRIEVRLVRMLTVFDSGSNSGSNSSSSSSEHTAAAAVTAAVTAATVSDVTVTHLSCDPVTPGVVLGLVGGRTVCMWDVGTGNVLQQRILHYVYTCDTRFVYYTYN